MAHRDNASYVYKRLRIEKNMHSDDEMKESFRGILATTELDGDFQRVTTRVLDSFADTLNTGKIKVYHNHRIFDTPLGRAMSGERDGEKCYTDFYLQTDTEKGREAVSLIKGGTLEDLSYGAWILEEKCDEDGELIDQKTLMSPNGYYAGMKMPDGHRVTTTITKAQLYEFSVANDGAVPGAGSIEALKQKHAEQAFSPEFIEHLGNRYRGIQKQLAVNIDLRNNPFEGVNFMSNPTPKDLDELTAERLREIVQEQQTKIVELEKRPTAEEMTQATKAKDDTIVELEAEIEKLTTDVDSQSYLAKQATTKIEELRPVAMRYYTKARGVTLRNKDDDEEYQSTQKMINECKNLSTLENFIGIQRLSLGETYAGGRKSADDVDDEAVIAGVDSYHGEPGMNY